MNARKKAQLLKAFKAFSKRITDRYADAYKALDEGDYVKAQGILAELALSHAKTSLSLRGVLIRDGLLPEEEK